MQRDVKLGNKIIGPNQTVYVIAEAGLNHGGDIELAIKMIEAAAEAGADAIKFQAFDTDERFGKDSECYALVKPTEFHKDQFQVLAQKAMKCGIDFISTAFDGQNVDMLLELGATAIKIASCDICNMRLLRNVATSDLPIIISRGTANQEEIETAMNVFRECGASPILLHCVSSYPLSEDSANLGAIRSLQNIFDIPIGYSDHTPGVKVPLFAVYAGAMVIEKHFTLNREWKGIDWEISAEPSEIKQLIQDIREAERILGHGRIEALPCENEEIEYRKKMRMTE